MKLSELRKIAAARTKGIWLNNDREVMRLGESMMGGERLITCDGGYASSDGKNQKNDAQFIAIAANHFDLLLDVIEAAKALVTRFEHDASDGNTKVEGVCFDWLVKKLAALEQE